MQLRVDESGAESVRRIVRRESKKAIESLTDTWPVADEAIHDARKRLKKVRAGLRMARSAMGRRAFRRENKAFRDAARPLSEIRDAKILIAALDELAKKASPTERSAMKVLRDHLVVNQIKARRRVLRGKGSLKPVVGSLRSARQRIRKRRAARGHWSVLGVGLRRVYRSGRDAFAVARSHPTVEHLHEWRKQVKYLWHQLQILEPIRPIRLRKLANQAHRLSDHLGDDHDLAMLRQRLSRASVRITSAARERIMKRMGDRREALQVRAMRLGARLYRETPRAFVKRLGDYEWRWRSRTGV
jgi:CHAD domain-containing protein